MVVYFNSNWKKKNCEAFWNCDSVGFRRVEPSNEWSILLWSSRGDGLVAWFTWTTFYRFSIKREGRNRTTPDGWRASVGGEKQSHDAKLDWSKFKSLKRTAWGPHMGRSSGWDFHPGVRAFLKGEPKTANFPPWSNFHFFPPIISSII